jgi:dTDP-glucose 4,6-dehydratase
LAGRNDGKILVAGGAEFIGPNFVRYLLHARVFIFAKLTYAGNTENLVAIARDRRHHFVRGDIADQRAVDEILRQHGLCL